MTMEFSKMELSLVLVEKDAQNNKRRLLYTPEGDLQIGKKKHYLIRKRNATLVKEFLQKVFLPAGYPQSVTSDYLQYQKLNALQAFCNSLASLLSSRAVLEGLGVGDPSATSTNAVLLNVVQDAFGRLTTIVGAYYVGTTLAQEAKAYRLLADILNDLALILDLFSPVLNTYLFPGARIAGLCISAALKALCGVIAGGSKAAITLHFASPLTGVGDVADVNAKDASMETVLSLAGMLLGSLVLRYVTSPFTTYTLLFALIISHLLINYIGVRILELRHFNKQRATLLWLNYREKDEEGLSPQLIATQEYLVDFPNLIREPGTKRVLGECQLGSTPLDVMRGSALSREFLGIFNAERYIICFDPRKPFSKELLDDTKFYPCLHICFKDKFAPGDQLKAWYHAVEICRTLKQKTNDFTDPEKEKFEIIKETYQLVKKEYLVVQDELKKAGWNLADQHYNFMGMKVPKATLYAVTATSERKLRM